MLGGTVATREAFFVGVAAGVLGAYALYKVLTLSDHQRATLLGMKRVRKSETDSTGDLDREIAFYFEDPEVYLRHAGHAKGTVQFAARCALLCEKYTEALQDFTGERSEATCLDIGCSIGAGSIELAKSFPHVLGLDASAERISVAEKLHKERKVEYTAIVEGSVNERREAQIDANLELEGVRYLVADPSALPEYLAAVDCVLAAMVLERLQCPKKLLESLPRLIKSDGTVVLVSSYSWDPALTPEKHRLGGYVSPEGKHLSSEEGLKGCMENLGFELKHEENVPFLRKLDDRKYESIVAQATIWKRKEGSSS